MEPLKISINSCLEHEIIETPSTLKDFVFQQLKLAMDLEHLLIHAQSQIELSEVLQPYLIDWWTPSNDMWELLWEKFMQIRKDLNTGKDRRLNTITGMREVLSELFSYVKPPLTEGSMLSVLRLKKILPGDPILLMMSATRTRRGESVQMYITRPPTMWIYLIMHPHTPGTGNLSILLHSITAYVNRNKRNVVSVKIEQPYAHMRQLLLDASKKYNFNIEQEKGGDVKIDLKDNDVFINVWKEWAFEKMCVNCLIKAQYICTSGFFIAEKNASENDIKFCILEKSIYN